MTPGGSGDSYGYSHRPQNPQAALFSISSPRPKRAFYLEILSVRTSTNKRQATNPPHHGSYHLVPVRAVCANLLKKRGSSMFLILAVVLVLLWLGGFFVLHVSSFLIHLLLIFALISIIMNFVGGKRAV
jgi:hypothetical protein